MLSTPPRAKENDSDHNNNKDDKGDQGKDNKKDGNKDNRRKKITAAATFGLTPFPSNARPTSYSQRTHFQASKYDHASNHLKGLLLIRMCRTSKLQHVVSGIGT
jgi:hypothetical protein